MVFPGLKLLQQDKSCTCCQPCLSAAGALLDQQQSHHLRWAGIDGSAKISSILEEILIGWTPLKTCVCCLSGSSDLDGMDGAISHMCQLSQPPCLYLQKNKAKRAFGCIWDHVSCCFCIFSPFFCCLSETFSIEVQFFAVF